MKSLEVMNSFNLDNLPTLDVAVLGALELFIKEDLPKIKIDYKKPLVVGSGNALATGKILFRDSFATFSSESDFEEKLKNLKEIDGVVLISASGGKDAPQIVKKSKEYKKQVTLITNNKNSLAQNLLDKKDNFFIFPKQREPYTYNTSTYLGMIFGKTGENPKKIYDFINKKLSKIDFSKFKEYERFYFIIPDKFDLISRMFHFKFMELFGRTIARDIETESGIKHGTTVVKSNELFVYFGGSNKSRESNSINIPLPSTADYGAMMAIGYFVIGKLQGIKENYFSKGLTEYTKEMSRKFNQDIKEIVE